MKDKLNQFIANVNGQFVEVSDHSNVYQCMDLAYFWVFCLGFPKESIQRLRAFEVYTKPTPVSQKYFDKIPNTIEAIPQDGDLVVWGGDYGPAGHIAIALGGGTTKTFKCFEQNNPLGTNAHIQMRNYDKVLGWLRPKVDIDRSVDPNASRPTLEVTDQTLLDLAPCGEGYGKTEFQQVKAMLIAKDAQIAHLEDIVSKYPQTVNIESKSNPNLFTQLVDGVIALVGKYVKKA